MKTIFISIVIPAYKEAERIGTTLVSLDAYFKTKKYTYEIIVVNDGSPDNLVEVVESYATTIKNLKIVNNTINRGKGYAVKCGMIEARGKYRLFMDADNSVSISNLDRFLLEVAKGSEVVIGSIEIGNEKKDEHNGFWRKFLSKVSKLPVRMLATPDIYDTQRGFKLFTSRAAEIIFPKQTVNRFAFDIELLVIAIANKLAIKELPVAFDNPTGSTVGMSAYTKSLGDLVRIIVRKVTGVYGGQTNMSLPRPTAGRIMVSTMVGIFVLGTILMISFVIKTGMNIQERSVSIVDELPLTIEPPLSAAELHASTLANAPSWIYARKPMTQNETGQLVLFSFLLILLGSDVVAGKFTPRLYALLKKSFFKKTPIPATPSYVRGSRNISRKLVPNVVS